MADIKTIVLNNVAMNRTKFDCGGHCEAMVERHFMLSIFFAQFYWHLSESSGPTVEDLHLTFYMLHDVIFEINVTNLASVNILAACW